MSIGIDPHPLQHDFANLPLGRLPKRDDPRTLQLAHYVDLAALPTIPPMCDWTAKVPRWPMYGNDRLGDCTWAAIGHMIEAWSYNAGHPKMPTGAVIERGYWRTGNPPSDTGVPGGPTDTGRVELDVLNYWRHTGVNRDHITAYAQIDPRNTKLVKAAIFLFGGVYTGIGLPVTAQRQQVWDYVGGPGSDPWSWGGHAVPYVAYDDQGVVVSTWGSLLRATWGFHAHYTEECYALINKDWLDVHGLTPAGFDQAALLNDLSQVGRVR